MTRTWYFDGGARPNPGPMEIAAMKGQTVHVRAGIGIGDSSEAEWRALLLAARLAHEEGDRDVRFVGDNAMVVAQARGKAACGRRLQPFLDAFITACAGFDRVQVRHVARSKNRAGAELARRR